MRIKFTGFVTFPERSDDRGSVNHWLVRSLRASTSQPSTTDDVFEKLSLTWEEVNTPTGSEHENVARVAINGK